MQGRFILERKTKKEKEIKLSSILHQFLFIMKFLPFLDKNRVGSSNRQPRNPKSVPTLGR
jgi:hypothetical protein